jgi:uncharacterized paraquat-inducible protein A
MVKLVKCPACGNEVSTGAASCPKCGHVLNAQLLTRPTFWRDPVIGAFSLLIVVALTVLVVWIRMGGMAH